MDIAIRYYTKTGNTKKLAEAIAKTVGVPAETIETPLEKADILFLGSSVYGGTLDPSVREFLSRLQPGQVSKIVVFGTAAILHSTYRPIKRIAKQKGLSVSDKEFHCRGQAGKLHANRPNEEDLHAVSLFANSFVQN
ncbi:flavodoxin [Sphaerochaeta pleomorpha str. Grapes]|uniref:Flavodoxin n=1 Tax=Sphaerochaeta pleomorpha (strain ATCC BAA-1885 / DSM 22778 / Grapes) TaxID=158190 RepID=G8QTM8_SPHPG|nr:flavodoxin family protein [Sphaerochaeta pleomorpha]AEV27993.1 flavodoxin [Sphaerochaeta pleomorpha str. Grapes]